TLAPSTTRMRLILVLAALVAAAAADKLQQQQQQKPAQGKLLSLPEPALCASRPKQWQFGGHNYFFSWDQERPGFYEEESQNPQENIGKKVNWLISRNECRRRCMDAVSIESEAENDMILEFVKSRNLQYIWTSGRLCDFTGCESRQDLKPLNINGWFWSGTNTKMAPTNKIPPGWSYQPWSQTGHTGVPQPDNAEFDINQTSESCLGVLNNIYKDGIKWHDIACYHPKPFVCEDSDVLLEYVRATNPGLQL
ncbi:hypothetical protein OTU49_007435, partial [Cherax quadricarinatus]